MRILNAIRLYISVHDGIDRQTRYRFDAQFLGDVLSVTDDRSEANIQFFSYLLIDKTLGDQYKHFDFAG